MSPKPLLIFPVATSENRSDGQGKPNYFHYPSLEEQVTRLEDKISELDRVLENQTAYLNHSIEGSIPEMVLVLEIAGDLDDFYRAIEVTEGMEFLTELEFESESDDFFFRTDPEGNKKAGNVKTRLFLSMTNLQAIKELKRYWVQYKNVETFAKYTGRFKTLFQQLKDIRPYSLQDRLRDTGFEEYLLECIEHNQSDIRFEVELVYKNRPEENDTAFDEVQKLLETYGGSVVFGSRTIIEEINYHSFIAEAPVQIFNDLTDNSNIVFLQSQKILFFRPIGQIIFSHEQPELEFESAEKIEIIPTYGQPVIALLDGLPLENHSLLQDRLIIDDPDGFSNNYMSQKRLHGTSMASLILNGDLDSSNEKRLTRPIYVRPIMKLDTNGEYLPNDKLPIDLVHRALKRMFEGEGETPPTASNVKIINFSIGDPFRPFHFSLSSWARLIDWLSYKYNVLFIISSGNYTNDIIVDIPAVQFDYKNETEIQNAVLMKILEQNFDRKILTPAESINSITIGAAHNDASTISNLFQRKNLMESKYLLSPISRIGFGFRRSIKPEILMPGGRKLYRKFPIQPDPEKTKLHIENFSFNNSAPGNRVALPGADGVNNVTGYTTGSSNAAALGTKLAGELYEILLSLNEEDRRLPDKYLTVLIKTLLVHGASWGEAKSILEDLVRSIPGTANNTLKKNILPYLGYGVVDKDKVLYCTDHRVTLLGFGELCKRAGENSHIYSFPLPNSLQSQSIDKKLTITLAWISPLNFSSSKYRKAKLYFDNISQNPHMSLNRDEYHFDTSQKGTVQHDILIGNQADAYIDDSVLRIKVNCMQEASGWKIDEKVKYGIAVTLEINENVETSIYEEIKQRVQQRIRPVI